jgi:tetratricopeptide (TPR) repeat protein
MAEHEGGSAGAVLSAARPGDAGVPYATLARLLRALLAQLSAVGASAYDSAQRADLARVLPELGAAPAADAPGGADALRLRHALEALFAAAQQAGVRALLVDDLHYADAASLESLLALMATPALASLHWGLARRPDDGVPALDALLLTLDETQRLVRVVLAPLAEPALAELVDSLAVPAWRGDALAAPLLRHSGGNPLFALETLKAMAQAGAAAAVLPRPATVAALIERRIRQLSAGALALARAAAVAETEFSIALAEHVLRSPALALADAWSELEGAQVLRGAAFAHDLVRDAVLAGVPAAIAAHLHAAIGQFLQARGGCPAARVAAHFEAGGEREQAAACWVQAGHQATTALRYVEATDAFERGARGYLEAGRSADAFDAAYQMRLAAYHVDLSARSEAALDLLDRCAASPVQRARAHNERGVMQLQRGDMTGVERHARGGLRALNEAVDAGTEAALLRAELRRNLAGVYRARGEPHAALAELRAVQADVEQHGDGMLKFHLWNALGLLLDETDDCDDACAMHQRAAEQALADNYLPGAAQILVNLAMTLHDCGRARDALAPLDRARMLLAGVPEAQRSFSRLPLATGVVMRALGDLGAALEHLERAVAQARVQTPGWLPMMAAERAQTLLYLGQTARAQQALAEAAPGPQTPPAASGKWHAVQAMLRRAQGPAGAAALVELLDGQPAGVRRLLRWRLQLQQLAYAAADEDALAQAVLIETQARDVGRIGVAIHAQVRAADLAQRLGGAVVRGASGGERAAAHARSALALMERWEPDDLYAGEALAVCHRVLAASGRADERDACLRRAAAWVREAALKVSAEFRDSFLNRNMANRELLTAATRLPRLAV